LSGQDKAKEDQLGLLCLEAVLATLCKTTFTWMCRGQGSMIRPGGNNFSHPQFIWTAETLKRIFLKLLQVGWEHGADFLHGRQFCTCESGWNKLNLNTI
jgi:hypothetical protein